MIEKERSSIIPAVISVWCTQFEALCGSCWLMCCNEEHGWHTAKSKEEQRCFHRCHKLNSWSNSLLFTFYQTHIVNVTPQYYYDTGSLWDVVMSVSFIQGHGCLITECVSPSVSVASWPRSSTQSKPTSLCCLVQGMLHLRWQGSSPPVAMGVSAVACTADVAEAPMVCAFLGWKCLQHTNAGLNEGGMVVYNIFI